MTGPAQVIITRTPDGDMHYRNRTNGRDALLVMTGTSFWVYAGGVIAERFPTRIDAINEIERLIR